MRFFIPMRDGSERPLVRAATVWLLLVTFVGSAAYTQTLYKYQDESGTWMYTDRRPPDDQEAEVRSLAGGPIAPGLTVETSLVGRSIRFTAKNDFAAPVEILLELTDLDNLEYPDPDQTLRWVVPGNSNLRLLDLAAINSNAGPRAEYHYIWLQVIHPPRTMKASYTGHHSRRRPIIRLCNTSLSALPTSLRIVTTQ